VPTPYAVSARIDGDWTKGRVRIQASSRPNANGFFKLTFGAQKPFALIAPIRGDGVGRPNGDGSKNLRLVISNPAKKPERAPPKPPEVPLIVRLLALAREWQGMA